MSTTIRWNFPVLCKVSLDSICKVSQKHWKQKMSINLWILQWNTSYNHASSTLECKPVQQNWFYRRRRLHQRRNIHFGQYSISKWIQTNIMKVKNMIAYLLYSTWARCRAGGRWKKNKSHPLLKELWVSWQKRARNDANLYKRLSIMTLWQNPEKGIGVACSPGMPQGCAQGKELRCGRNR